MKFLYVLVSNEKDVYYEQTLMSALSLKHHNPDAFISLIVDDKTDLNMTGFRSKLKSMAQEYIVVPFDESISNLIRSRLLKTNMRNYLQGDFLFLDGDTVVTTSIEKKVENFDFELGAVSDLHGFINDKYHVKHKKINANRNIMNFKFSWEHIYFNSGVIFSRDCEVSKKFFDKWHSFYKQCVEHQIYTDQLSFNESNHHLNFPLYEMSGDWNCQVREAYNHLYRIPQIYPCLCNSNVIHFFGSGNDKEKEPHPLMEKSFFEKIKQQKEIDEKSLSIVYNPKNYFYGVSSFFKIDDSSVFFIYRQFPLIFKIILFIIKLRKNGLHRKR